MCICVFFFLSCLFVFLSFLFHSFGYVFLCCCFLLDFVFRSKSLVYPRLQTPAQWLNRKRKKIHHHHNNKILKQREKKYGKRSFNANAKNSNQNLYRFYFYAYSLLSLSPSFFLAIVHRVVFFYFVGYIIHILVTGMAKPSQKNRIENEINETKLI